MEINKDLPLFDNKKLKYSFFKKGLCGITSKAFLKSINIPHTILPVSSALEILSVSVIMAWVVLYVYD